MSPSLMPSSYSYVAKEGNQVLTDYGVVVVYKS